jgi:transposase
MDVQERMSGDRAELGRRIDAEKNAKQRDRYRAAALAIDGCEAEAIAETLSRSRRFVQRWGYAYRDGGIDAIAVKRQKGPEVRLTPDEQERLARRLEAGPLPGDGVCALRGRDIVEILRKEFEKPYSLNGVYDLLGRMGFSSLRPRHRHRHRKNDPVAMEAFKASAPLLSTPCVNATPTSRSRSGSRTKPASGSRAR